VAITTLTIGGSAVALPGAVALDRLVVYTRGGIPTLSFSVRGGPLVGIPDPYLAKPCVLAISGTTQFTGDVLSMHPDRNPALGWVRQYQALGIRNRGDWFPHTDSVTLSDTSTYNLSADNQQPDYLASRAGRTVGQILTDVLTMATNAANMATYGLSTSSATTADLAALTLIPPCPIYFAGERFLTSIESLLATWAPNYTLWVKPDGTLRFLDLRSFAPNTLTIDDNPPTIYPSAIARDCTNNFTQVIVRGAPIAEPFLFSLSLGGLSESPFAHDGLTVAAAKAAWKPADWTQPGLAGGSGVAVGSYDKGTCTCPSTTSVTVTSSNPLTAYGSDWWDQTPTGRHGVMMLQFSSGTLVTSYAARSVVANTALSAGGSATFTLDRALPNLLFDHYTVTGTTKDASVVWCVYQLPSWAGGSVAKQTTFPFPFHTSSGLAVTTTSAPTGWLLYSDTGSPPFQEYATPVTVDPSSGTIRFAYPTFLTVGGHVPTDVRAVVPIYTAANRAYAPSSSTYAGTANTVEGIARTLVVTVPSWRDPANQTAMNVFAADILDSCKDTVLEGTVTYLGLYTTALTMGMALNVAGNGYVTGWEAGTVPAIPVVEVQVEWPLADGLDNITTMRCSSRRGHMDAAAFLRPDRTGITWDFGAVDPREYGAGGVDYYSAPIQVALTPASGLAPASGLNPEHGLAPPSGLAPPQQMAGPNDNFDRSGMNQRGMI
jgi:hypothetical protein